jgi:hypothetical protein
MAALTVSNSFTAGTSIVASQMNTNFGEVVTWATGTPFISATGLTTSIKGDLTVTELATFIAGIEIQGSNPVITFEGATSNAHQTLLHITDPTADRTITLPDATGTVALTSDITTPVTAVTGTAPIVSSGGYTPAISVTTNDAQLILNNTIFN